MSYTTLKVTEAGVVHLEAHAARLARLDASMRARFLEWAATATPGLYVLRAAGGGLTVERRERSRLFEGIPVRYAASPFAGQRGAFPKPAPPSPYDGVRAPGVATLLTDAEGTELYESCSASVLAWDGAALVAVPEDTPRVASVAEACVREALSPRRARIPLTSSWPLVLVNAAAGVCAPSIPSRGAFPEEVRDAIAQALARSTRRPPRPRRRSARP